MIQAKARGTAAQATTAEAAIGIQKEEKTQKEKEGKEKTTQKGEKEARIPEPHLPTQRHLANP